MDPSPEQDAQESGSTRLRLRLQQLSKEWNLPLPPHPHPLPPAPEEPPSDSHPTEADIVLAEQLLENHHQQQQSRQHRGSSSTLIRAAFFPTKKKKEKRPWSYAEIHSTLTQHIEDRGSPGIAQVLIMKLEARGHININTSTTILTDEPQNKSLIIGRRRRREEKESNEERRNNTLLQLAVTNSHVEMVKVLIPYSDAQALDTALSLALRLGNGNGNGNDEIAELLVRSGGTSASHDAFRHACQVGGHANLVRAILDSDVKPPAKDCLSQCMVDAARAGCLETVTHLARSGADGNYDSSAALKSAVALGRKDIALVLILGNKAPQNQGVNEAFAEHLVQQQRQLPDIMTPDDRLGMTEILLCAGATGDFVAKALAQACESHSLEMVRLLVSYSAPIENDEAQVLREAVTNGKVDLARAMLSGTSTLSSERASECVELLPKDLAFEDRYFLLAAFLNKGAAGAAIDEALIDAVEVGDIEAVRLLVTPTFPDEQGTHVVASTEYKGALALQVAVEKAHGAVASLILTHKPPSQLALAQVFPSTRNLPRLERYQITELFLSAGLTGACVHSALEKAISELPSRRDEKLISLLLRHTAHVSFNEGDTITAAIANNDIPLLEALLSGKPTAQTIAKAVPRAMEVADGSARVRFISMLLDSGLIPGSAEISAALLAAVVARPTDKRLIQLLLQQGGADVNVNEGVAVEQAAQHPDPEILELLLTLGSPNDESVGRALKSLAKLPPSSAKAGRLKSLLARSRRTPKEALGGILVEEVQALVKMSPQERNFSVLKTLLVKGADVNALNGEALSRAVAASSMQIVEVLLTASPSPMTLAWVMPHALRIRDPMDRLTYAQMILAGGMPPDEVNRALVFAVRRYSDDIPLISALLPRADTTDGTALIEAIKVAKPIVLEMILGTRNFAPVVLNAAFMEATKTKDKRTRAKFCNSLLKAGASGEVVSDALLAAATDGDVALSTILVQNGGSPNHKNGQAVVEACKSGAVGVLEMLMMGGMRISQETLQKAFQGATQVGDLTRRALVFRILLHMGVTGEIVDMQLVSAVRYGDEGTELVKLLLLYGASPDYNGGEAVEKAVRSAFLGSLELLLGISPDGQRITKQQKKPSSYTLVRGLDACWDLSRDTRFIVVDWLFRAGVLVPSAVHSALHRAVNEPVPEERLIRLFLSYRSSPVVNGCQTLIDAATTVSASMFGELLETRATSDDASLVFSKAFTAGNSASWVSERGLKIAARLLEKGAKGNTIGSALVAVLNRHMQTPHPTTAGFVDLLLRHGADVNYNSGEPLQIAAFSGSVELLARLLDEKPGSETLTSAFPRVFDAPFTEDHILELVALFAEHRNDNSQLNIFSERPGSDPVVIRALSRFPRSTKILEAVLDVGFYHEQMVRCNVVDEAEEPESVTLLMWVLLQPQKKISTALIDLLLERGAKVNFQTSVSGVTPLMQAIRAHRQDVVKLLLLAGAEVDVTDALGNSPLSMASSIGGDLAIDIMSNLLAAGASKNDGSLHNSARELNIRAMQVLVEYGHEPDFPSILHGGRSALAELCLHATDSLEVTVKTEKAMERAIEFLLRSGSDITIQSESKSALVLALESAEPVTTTKVLLRAGLWKEINKPFNQYSDGKFTYSPTMYVKKVLQASEDGKTALLNLLRANRGTDVYYANSGRESQPEDAVGTLPPHLQREEEGRRARRERDEDHTLAIQRDREIAAVRAQIRDEQAELEEARKRRAHGSDMALLRERAHAEEELFNDALRRQRARQLAEVEHQENLATAAVARTRAIGEAELGVETTKHARLLEWEQRVGGERLGNANQLSSVRLREREEMERLDEKADARFRDRVRDQKRLVDSQRELALGLDRNGNGNGSLRRQIGFVSGELSPD
ncbi:hypothetical protein F5Y17DRAFT_477145 [Xylariaceae sp. FL0594]|nr:hypothetical protein F5Y17DRAFT_477145 [Xylariaceae sp. FL0594]